MSVFDDAVYYSVEKDIEVLTHETVDDALSEYFDDNFRTNVLEDIEDASPVTVYAWNRVTIPTGVLRIAVEIAAESLADHLHDEYASPDAEHFFRAELHKKLEDGIQSALMDVMEEHTVWACEIVDEREFSAEAVEVILRKCNPHWFTAKPSAGPTTMLGSFSHADPDTC